MNKNYISWDVSNLVTVNVMVILGFMIVGTLGVLFNKFWPSGS